MAYDVTADKVTDATVTIELYVQSVTISDDATADILYNRTITDKSDGTVIVRDVVRETESVVVAQPLIDSTMAKIKTRGAANGQ